MKILFTIVLIFFLPLFSFSQNEDIDQIIDEIHFGKDSVKSAFQWVAKNIDYDISMMLNNESYVPDDSALTYAIAERKGVCLHFALLFQAICQRLGYECYTITGYVYANNKLGRSSHAWNAVHSGNSWYFYDPTWAGGYVADNFFQKRYNSYWHKVKPKAFIKSHIPFDPIWQLLENPLTHEQISRRETNSEFTRTFNFQDSIANYLSQSTMERDLGELRRLLSFGVVNPFIEEEATMLLKEINVIEYNKKVKVLNAGVDQIGKAVNELNRYFYAKNNFFKSPDWNDEKIRKKLEKIDSQFKAAQKLFLSLEYDQFEVSSLFSKEIKATYDLSYFLRKDQSLMELGKHLDYNLMILKNLSDDVKKEKLFLEKYLNTEESSRLATFEPY